MLIQQDLSKYPFMPIKYGSIGRPTPGHDVRIVDDDGNELPTGEEGNIAICLGEQRRARHRGQGVRRARPGLRAGYEPSDALTKELQDHVKKTTAPYRYPRLVEYATDLPKTISGKILRRELRKR
jgi:acyl-coenzyme A synthetase/AMP-(fatty) acid ligase